MTLIYINVINHSGFKVIFSLHSPTQTLINPSVIFPGVLCSNTWNVIFIYFNAASVLIYLSRKSLIFIRSQQKQIEKCVPLFTLFLSGFYFHIFFPRSAKQIVCFYGLSVSKMTVENKIFCL